eukprot:Tbor_TRINITY_DN5939_c0_g1::TRINITY_DN5939_c0_g1_i5::g.18729::m.18729/K15289/SLC35F5; solute carrier family 35, member F5
MAKNRFFPASLFCMKTPKEKVPEGTSGVHDDDIRDPHARGTFKERARAYCTGRHFFGIVLVILVAFIWVGASILIQLIFHEYDYNKPLFLTYFNTTGFAFWNLGFLFSKSWRKVPYKDKKQDIDKSDDAEQQEAEGICVTTIEHPITPEVIVKSPISPRIAIPETVDIDGNTTCPHSKLNPNIRENEDTCDLNPESQRENCTIEGPYCNEPIAIEGQESPSFRETDELKPYSLYKIAKGALFFCPVWFLANVLFNYSLAYTSVASNTIISTTSSIWTIVTSKVLLNHNICMVHKMIAVVFSLTGAVLVALYDSSNGSVSEVTFDAKSVIGNVLALVSAMFYACYITVLKWALPDDNRFRVGMVFGFVGLWNIVLMWPGIVLLHCTGIEIFELPSPMVFLALAANSAIGTNLSDVMLAKSVLLTSPLVATLGLSLTIPIAMLADSIMKSKEYSPLYILGALLVIIGFVTVNLRSV